VSIRRAVAQGLTICVDIKKNLRWSQIAANAEKTFGVDEAEMDRILPVASDVLCKGE
jgi:hypothetical protein